MHRCGLILLVLVPLTLTGLAGCDSGSKPGVEIPAYYPVRSDWMVAGNLSISELLTSYSDAGYPPILQLNGDLKSLTGPAKLLATQIPTKVVLDTRKLSEPERREFAEILDKLFGTPEKPRVESAEAMARLEKWIAEKEAKLALNQTAELQNEIATLRGDLELVQLMTAELQLDEKTLESGGRVFRNYCQQCHGLTGNGNGPDGRFLIPVPRLSPGDFQVYL